MPKLQEFLRRNEGSASLACIWDPVKAFMRGLYIREISKRKTKTREVMVAIRIGFGRQRAFVYAPSDDTRKAIDVKAIDVI